MPISQKRELEIERELAWIMRELDRLPSIENPGPKKPKHAVQPPWTPPLLLDFDEQAARPGVRRPAAALNLLDHLGLFDIEPGPRLDGR